MNSQIYRPDIDGLRAIAIIPVIFFHFKFSLFQSGFLGVDIFFVISGYLITNLLIRELNKGSFSYLNFFERRIRRIIPALYFVILITIPLSWHFLSSGLIWDYWQSVVSSSVFLSNFLFALENNYFDISSDYKPLIHTWSLSIEEQFYIFFPFIFYLCFKIKNLFISIIFLLFIISLLVFLYNPKIPIYFNINFLNRLNDIGIGSYYISISRFWEIFLGSIASYFSYKYKIKKFNFLSLFGLIVIFSIFILYDENLSNKKIYIFFITLSTSLVIVFTSYDSLVGKLLSNKFLVYIGLLSYSLYLVHQPIITYMNIIYFEKNIEYYFLTLLIIILLSIFVNNLIEKPFRNKYFLTTRTIYLLFFIFTIFFISIGNFGLSKKISLFHYNQSIKNIDDNYINLVLNIKNEGEKANNKILNIKNFNIIDPDKKNLLFVGDSQSWDWIRSLTNSTIKDNYNFNYVEINSNCYYYFEDFHNSNLKKNNCLKSYNQLIKNSVNSYSAIIILNSFSNTNEINNIKYLINIFSSQKDKIVLIGNAEFVDITLYSYHLAKLLSEKSNRKFTQVSNKVMLNSVIKINQYIDIFSKQNDIHFINEYNFFCNNEYCKIFSDSYEPLFYDNMHFTDAGENFVSKKIILALNKLNLIY